jgi:hypothetical protein
MGLEIMLVANHVIPESTLPDAPTLHPRREAALRRKRHFEALDDV